MFRKTLFRGLAMLMLTVSAPAFAQSDLQPYASPDPVDSPPRSARNRSLAPDAVPGRLLPPRAIVGSLYERGYRNVQIRRVRGDSYITVADGPDGRVLIVVDGYTTEITGLRQLGWNRPPRQWDNEGWFPPRPWGPPRW